MTESCFKTRIHNTYPLKDVAKAHDVSPKVVFSSSFWLMEVAGSPGPEKHGQIAHGSLDEESKGSLTHS